jgi:mycothiol synthase
MDTSAIAHPSQLRMLWPTGCMPRMPRIPKGYRLRTWRDGDAEGYRSVMLAAGFEPWPEENIVEVLKASLPNGLFFVIHEAEDRIVATSVACHNPIDHHPFGGELGWVAVDPMHRGHGLGAVTSTAVVRRFQRAEYQTIYLRTDDFRLPAIRLYLAMGFRPFLFEADMEARWKAAFLALGREWSSSSGVVRLHP